MVRNYFVPGFALVLLAVFAAPRSTPVQQPEARRSTTKEAASNPPPSPGQPAASSMPKLLGSKSLFDPKGVCALARTQMHEKLAEFNLDYPNSEGPASAETTSGKSEAKEPVSEAMIALVPDPIHTHLALLFDRYVEVMQQALQWPRTTRSWYCSSECSRFLSSRW